MRILDPVAIGHIGETSGGFAAGILLISGALLVAGLGALAGRRNIRPDSSPAQIAAEPVI